MRYLVFGRWHAALAVSLFVNIAVFSFTSHMGAAVYETSNIEYVAVDLIGQAPEAYTEPVAKPVAQPKPAPMQKTARLENVVEPSPQALPPVEKEIGLSETAPQLVEKETAQPEPAVATAAVVRDAEATPVSASAPQPAYHAVGTLTKKPRFSVRVEPVYPESLRASGKEGKVLVEVFLSDHGSIDDLKIIQSGGAALDNAVIRALKASRIEPGYMKDRPVPVKVQIPFVFKLS